MELFNDYGNFTYKILQNKSNNKPSKQKNLGTQFAKNLSRLERKYSCHGCLARYGDMKSQLNFMNFPTLASFGLHGLQSNKPHNLCWFKVNKPGLNQVRILEMEPIFQLNLE